MQEFDWRLYQKMAWATVKYPGMGRDIMYPCLGLVGEVCNELLPKLQTCTGTGLDDVMVKDILITLGDALWYVSVIAQTEDIDLDQIMSSVHMPSVALSPQRPGNRSILTLIGWVGTLLDRVARKSNNCLVPDDFIRVLISVVQGLTNIASNLGVTIGAVADMNINKIRGVNGKEKAE